MSSKATVSGIGAIVITPSDSENLEINTRGIYVGVSGDVTVDMVKGGTNLTFTAVAAGIILPIQVSRVYSTGTTATNIVGVY